MIELMASNIEEQCGTAAPILPLLLDPEVTDIFINGTHSLYIERNGKTEKTGITLSPTQLWGLVEKWSLAQGKRWDAARPYLEGVLADGSRFHMMMAPLADPAPVVSIRKHQGTQAILLSSMGTDIQIQALLQWVLERRNFLIVGATGAGKTTLLSLLLDQVPASERVILIEECPEILLRHDHLVRLVARPCTPDGKGEVSLRELVRNSLRMRPERLVVGECRGAEVVDFLQAMSTGHTGSMGTLHAKTAREALTRLEVLVALSGQKIERNTARHWIAQSLEGVVVVERLKSGVRQIQEVVEVKGWEGEHFRLLPIAVDGL